MERLKLVLEKYSRWQPLSQYVERIEGFRQTDFSICVENSKSLLESVAKEICDQKKQPLEKDESMGKLVRLSFSCLGHNPTKATNQIAQAIAAIGQQMGEFRNEIGMTAHGKTLDELKNRDDIVSSSTGDFLIFSTELVCCFLIESFETGNSQARVEPKQVEFDENADFNNFWDEQYGEFEMGDYSYAASDVLFNVDPQAYATELNTFNSSSNEPEAEITTDVQE